MWHQTLSLTESRVVKRLLGLVIIDYYSVSGTASKIDWRLVPTALGGHAKTRLSVVQQARQVVLISLHDIFILVDFNEVLKLFTNLWIQIVI